MSYRICETLETEKQAMRDVYCQTMIDLANQNDRIVVMGRRSNEFCGYGTIWGGPSRADGELRHSGRPT